MKKILLLLFLASVLALNPIPGDWWGNVYIDGNLASDGAFVEALVNNVSSVNTTVGNIESTYYLLHVPGSDGDNVTFEVYGVESNSTTWSDADHELDLYMTTLANGESCEYNGTCSGGLCSSGVCADSGNSITLTYPNDGVGLSGIITLNATTSATADSVKFEYYNGSLWSTIGTNGTDGTVFTKEWNTTLLEISNATVKSTATFSGGEQRTDTSTNITITNAAFTATLSPSDSTTTDNTVAINMTFSRAATITEAYVDTVSIKNAFSTSDDIIFLYTTNALTDGEHTITVTGQAQVGGTEVTETSTITVDANGPSFSNQYPASNARTSDNQTLISANISDSVSTVNVTSFQLVVNGTDVTASATNTTTYFTYTPGVDLPEGTITVIANVSDSLGNVGETSWSFVVDTTAPTLTVTSPTNGEVTRDSTLTVSGTTDGDNLTINGDAVTITAQAFSTTVTLTEGSNTITLNASDATSYTTKSYTVTLDTTAPTLTVTTPSNYATVSTTPVWVNGTTESGANVFIDDVAATMDGTSFSKSEALTNGTNTFTIRATDSAGNNATTTLTVYLDQIPPTLTITSPVDGQYTNQGVFTVKGTTDPGATLLVNGSSATVLATGSFSKQVTLSNGANVINVTAIDSYGNSNEELVTVTLATSKPVVSITSIADGTLTTTAAQTISGTITNSSTLTSVTLTHNGAVTTLANNSAFSQGITLTEGSNIIKVTAVDSASNTGSHTITVTLDTTDPTVTITSITSPTATAETTISGAVSDTAITSATLTLNGNAETITVNNGAFSKIKTLQEGVNSIQISVSDAAGNTGSKSASVTLDSTAPTVTLNAITTPTATAAHYVSGSVNDLTVTSGTLYINGVSSSITISSGSFNVLKTLSEGTNLIKVTAADSLGNTGTSTTRTVVVDTTTPTASNKFPLDSSTTSDNTPFISLDLLDLGSGIDTTSIAMTVNGGAVTPNKTTTQVNYTPGVALAEGAVAVVINASDKAGNEVSTSWGFTIDTSAPTLTITSPSNGLLTTNATLNVTGTTDGTTVTVNGEAATLNAGSFYKVITLSSGTNTITTTSSDVGGTSTDKRTVTLDSTAPTFSISYDKTSPVALGNIEISVRPSEGLSATPSINVTQDGGSTSTLSTTLDSATNTYQATYAVTSTDGTATVVVYGSDNAGNTGSSTSSFVVDTTPPTISITTLSDGDYITSETKTVTAISVDATSSVSSVKFEYYDSSWHTICTDTATPFSCSWDLSSISDQTGLKVRATTTDSLGNINTTTVTNLVHDTTKPSITNYALSNRFRITGETITITTDLADVTSGLNTTTLYAYVQKPDETNVISIPLTLSSGTTFTGSNATSGLTEGTYYVDLKAYDLAGNSREIENFDYFTVAENYYSNTSVNISNGDTGCFDAYSTIGVKVCVKVNADQTNEQFNISKFPGNVAGVAADGVGDMGKFPVVDTTIPNNEITLAQLYVYYTGAELTASGLLEQSLRVYYWNTSYQNWDVLDGANGTDSHGNYVYGNTTHFSEFGAFGAETNPPSASANSPTTDTNDTTPDITVKLTDAESGMDQNTIIMKVNDQVVSPDFVIIPDGYRLDYTPSNALSEGTNTVNVTGDDNAGNSFSEPFVWSFTVDETAPSALSISIAGGASTATSQSVTLTLSATGADDCRYSNDGSTWSSYSTYTTSKSWTLSSGDGAKTVYYQCKDDAGNVADVVNDTITLSVSTTEEEEEETTTNPSGDTPSLGPQTQENPFEKNFEEEITSEELTELFSTNENVKKAIEQTGLNVDVSVSSEVASNTKVESKISHVGTSSSLSMTFTYSGTKTVKKKVLVIEVPKNFAVDASEITVITSGEVQVVNADPAFAVTFTNVMPGQELSVDFTTDKIVNRNDVMNSLKSPVIIADAYIVSEEPVVEPTLEPKPEPKPESKSGEKPPIVLPEIPEKAQAAVFFVGVGGSIFITSLFAILIAIGVLFERNTILNAYHKSRAKAHLKKVAKTRGNKRRKHMQKFVDHSEKAEQYHRKKKKKVL